MPKNRVDDRPLSTAMPIIVLFVAIGLSGCAIDPARDEARLLAPVAGEPLRKADALAAQGQADAAAEAYLNIAEGTTPPAREQLLLKAARAYLSAGDTRQAQQTIGEISRQALTGGQREQLLLIEADLALLDGRPKDAIARLQAVQVQTLPKELKIQRLGTLAAAQRLANDPVASAESLVALDRLLDSEDARLLNQVSLVTTLSTMSSDQLRKLTRSASGAMKGWAEIALLAHDAGADPATFQTRYRQEQSKRFGHRAHPRLAEAYVEILSGGYAAGDKVTVMLPRGGRFAGAAAAVKEGIEGASRTDTSGNRPALEFADSTRAERARAIQAKAVAAGADYVIGPLEKEAVDSLATGPALAVPTLALNQATRDTQPAANLFQFSLSPENEAAEVADKAAAMGLTRAAVLYPEGPWGARLASAFRNQWRRLGGTLEAEAVYNPTDRSFEKTVGVLLDDSKADILFLVATNELAHKMYPRIRLAASSVTVISTSHVYSGVFDPTRDRVLSGLYFVDIPWMLNSGGEGALSRRRLSGSSFEVANPLARLYAMGIDAYRITPRLPALAKNPGAFYPGQTGGLAIDALGRIQRRLALGRFGETGVIEAGNLSETPVSETP